MRQATKGNPPLEGVFFRLSKCYAIHIRKGKNVDGRAYFFLLLSEINKNDWGGKKYFVRVDVLRVIPLYSRDSYIYVGRSIHIYIKELANASGFFYWIILVDFDRE